MIITCICGNKIDYQECACSFECLKVIHQPDMQLDSSILPKEIDAKVLWRWMNGSQRVAALLEQSKIDLATNKATF